MHLGKVLEKHPDIFILSDEIYEHINYGTPHFSIAAIPELYDRTITVNGVAKAFAMTGWRIGYIGAPEWLAKACNKNARTNYLWSQLYRTTRYDRRR